MDDRTCSIPDCGKPVKGRGWCSMHYERWRTHGDLLARPRKAAAKPGDTSVDVHGYRRVYLPGHPMAVDRGWAPEHRAVAWDHFGPFDPSMEVHHRNHDRLDNRPENLELLTKAEHLAEHGDEWRRIDRDETVRLYLSGLSTTEVAERVGTHPGKVSRILKAKGVATRTPAETKALRRHLTEPFTPGRGHVI